MSGPPNFSFEKIGSPAPRFAAASPSLTGTAPQLPRDLVIDKLHRRIIMELAINARIAHLENMSRSLNRRIRSEEHTSELQSLMRISYAVFCLKKKKYQQNRKRVSHL